MLHTDLLVIGGGVAGMAAALSAAENGAERIIIAEREDKLGGILPQCIHNGFGLGYFKEDLTGPQYAESFTERICNSSVEVWLQSTVISIAEDKTAIVSSAEKGMQRISFEKLVLASGCRETPIGALPVTGTRPAGIFTAGQAQRMVNLQGLVPGRNIVILGSGDIGLIMARRFTLIGCTVLAVIEKQSQCGGMLRNYRNCILAHNIPLLTDCTVTQVHGENRITGVTVHNLISGEDTYMPCDTLITAVGLIPERELLRPFGDRIPDWIRLCGNCDYVHEIVDTVTAQAEKLGTEIMKKEWT